MKSVYLIKCEQYHKIGIAADVDGRLKSIRTGNPFELSVIMQIKRKNAKGIEPALHSLFSNKHHRGEWFLLDGNDIELIQECIRVSQHMIYGLQDEQICKLMDEKYYNMLQGMKSTITIRSKRYKNTMLQKVAAELIRLLAA